jgi:hypothetical protein
MVRACGHEAGPDYWVSPEEIQDWNRTAEFYHGNDDIQATGQKTAMVRVGTELGTQGKKSPSGRRLSKGRRNTSNTKMLQVVIAINGVKRQNRRD